MDKPKQITLKTVLHEINEPGHVFHLVFRTLDGDLCEKLQVKKNPSKAADQKDLGKKDLGTIKRQINQEGALILYDCKQRHPFEAKIALLVAYNGYQIFHSY